MEDGTRGEKVHTTPQRKERCAGAGTLELAVEDVRRGNALLAQEAPGAEEERLLTHHDGVAAVGRR